MSSLRATFPSVANFRSNKRHVDISNGRLIRKFMTPTLMGHNQPIPQSLAKLVEKVLGLALSKNSRISDWERRPLAVQQVRCLGGWFIDWLVDSVCE